MNPWVEPNDTLSSLHMAHYDSDADIGAATFYGSDDCSREQGFLFATTQGNSMGYNFDDMWNYNVPDNGINAVRIPLGYTVEFYAEPNFRGEKTVM